MMGEMLGIDVTITPETNNSIDKDNIRADVPSPIPISEYNNTYITELFSDKVSNEINRKVSNEVNNNIIPISEYNNMLHQVEINMIKLNSTIVSISEQLDKKLSDNINYMKSDIIDIVNNIETIKTNLYDEWNKISSTLQEKVNDSLRDVNIIYMNIINMINRLKTMQTLASDRLITSEFMDSVTRRLDNMEKIILFRGINCNCDRCNEKLNINGIYIVNCCSKFIICFRCSSHFVRKTTPCIICPTACTCLQHVKCIT